MTVRTILLIVQHNSKSIELMTLKKGHKMNQQNEIKKEWLNPREVFREFGLSISTLAKWRMVNKHLPFSKVGKYIKYKRSDIEAFLNANIIEVA